MPSTVTALAQMTDHAATQITAAIKAGRIF